MKYPAAHCFHSYTPSSSLPYSTTTTRLYQNMEHVRNAFRTIVKKDNTPFQPDPWKGNWRRRRRSRKGSSTRPNPLPAHRKRPLTPDAVNGWRKKSAKTQDKCLLFSRLPIEIRQLIYREVLASSEGQELHVCSSHKRLLSHRCHVYDPYVRGWRHDCWGSTAMDGTTINWMEDGLGPEQQGMQFNYSTVIGLLCSCRRMYVLM